MNWEEKLQAAMITLVSLAVVAAVVLMWLVALGVLDS